MSKIETLDELDELLNENGIDDNAVLEYVETIEDIDGDIVDFGALDYLSQDEFDLLQEVDFDLILEYASGIE